MFRLCHFSKYISFSKINRLQGFARVADVQTLSFLKVYIIFKDKRYISFSKIKDIYHFQR